MIEFDTILNAFVTLSVTIDPIGLAPVFIGITAGLTSAQKRSVALRAVLISASILIVALFTGQIILDTMGISIGAFRVAGGLLLFFTAFEMVYGSRQKRKEETTQRVISQDDLSNIAVFPLAMPLIAGPGAISASILLASSNNDTWQWHLVLVGVVLFVLFTVYLAFIASDYLDKLLGNTGRLILTRLLGLLLAALSVQFVVDGLLSMACCRCYPLPLANRCAS